MKLCLLFTLSEQVKLMNSYFTACLQLQAWVIIQTRQASQRTIASSISKKLG